MKTRNKNHFEIIMDTGETRTITEVKKNKCGLWYLDNNNILIHESRLKKEEKRIK